LYYLNEIFTLYAPINWESYKTYISFITHPQNKIFIVVQLGIICAHMPYFCWPGRKSKFSLSHSTDIISKGFIHVLEWTQRLTNTTHMLFGHTYFKLKKINLLRISMSLHFSINQVVLLHVTCSIIWTLQIQQQICYLYKPFIVLKTLPVNHVMWLITVCQINAVT